MIFNFRFVTTGILMLAALGGCASQIKCPDIVVDEGIIAKSAELK